MPIPRLLPFEADFEELRTNADSFVDGVFASLESAFLVMPRALGFVSYPILNLRMDTRL